MKATQIYALVNTAYQQATGQSDIVQEDLKNIVDVGTIILSAEYREPYVNSLFNQIGRMVFVDRPYNGVAPKIIRESWEWGSIMSKSRTKDFTAVQNPAWSLVRGETVNQFEYQPPEVQTTLYNELITWEIDCSFVQRQIRQSFQSAEQMDRFLSMIQSHIVSNQNANIDDMILRALSVMMGYKLHANVGVIDLLTAYNTRFSKSLTAENAITDKEFERFAAFQILLYRDRMRARTAAFIENDPGYTAFTPDEYSHVVLLSDMGQAMKTYLQSDTYHDDLVKIGKYETVPYFQGIGENGFGFDDITHIDVLLPQKNGGTADVEVNRNHIIGTIFDRDAVGIINEETRVEVTYNRKGEYWNNFYKIDTRLFVDPAEQCIVFTLGSGNISE